MKLDAEAKVIPLSQSSHKIPKLGLQLANCAEAIGLEGWGWSSPSSLQVSPVTTTVCWAESFSLDSLVSEIWLWAPQKAGDPNPTVLVADRTSGNEVKFQIWSWYFQKSKIQTTRDAKGEQKVAESLRTHTARSLLCSNQTIRFDPITQTVCLFSSRTTIVEASASLWAFSHPATLNDNSLFSTVQLATAIRTHGVTVSLFFADRVACPSSN